MTPRPSLTRRLFQIVWAPVSVVTLHALIVVPLGHRPVIDPVFHVLGGAAGAFSLLQVIRWLPGVARGLPGWRRDLAIVSVTFAVAIVWEIAEVLSNRLLGTNINVETANTVADLGLGVGGAVVCVLVSAINDRRPANG